MLCYNKKGHKHVIYLYAAKAFEIFLNCTFLNSYKLIEIMAKKYYRRLVQKNIRI